MNVRQSFLLVLGLFLLACVRIPQATRTYTNGEKIQVAPGPEDIQLYRYPDSTQVLLISCDDRRNKQTFGSIWSMDVELQEVKPFMLKFIHPPSSFHPHGISAVDSFLFVIDHFEDYKKSCIRRFVIRKDTLLEDTVFFEGIIGFPNDMVALSRDHFLYADYSRKGAVVRFENGIFYRITPSIRKANGVDSVSIDGFPFGIVSATYGKKIYIFDTQSGQRKKYFKVKGGDNFTYSDGKLLVASHLRFGKFIRHAKNSKRKSPTVIYELDILNKKKYPIFVDDGKKISGASVAIWVNGKLYIGQIFDDFIWVTYD
jgi:hypothetical protein